MQNIRVGVINWDCSLPRETYFGYYQTRTLSPRKYRHATPFYADIVDDNRIDYHLRTQAEFDRELCYAIDAGIDYFTYVFYPDHASRNHISTTYADCSHRVYELTYARRMHASSRYRHKIGMAFIVTPSHPLDDEDLAELVALLHEPYYETVEGRPLVYLYQSTSTAWMERVRRACLADGLAAPFFVPMVSAIDAGGDSPLIDALSQYACAASGTADYASLCEAMTVQNRRRLSSGHRIIPLFTTGWDPSPRIDIPAPWCQYPEAVYAPPATPQELLLGAIHLADWICEEARDAFFGHIMTFAWNEFEEGAWICPTYTPDLHISTERVRIFSEISAYWKQRLQPLL